MFSVCRPQYFIPHTKPQRLLVTRHRLSCEKVNLHNTLVTWALGRLCSQLINFKCVIRGHSQIKVTGMLVGKFILSPQGSPMWMWLKLKLTPKRAFCVGRAWAHFQNRG